MATKTNNHNNNLLIIIILFNLFNHNFHKNVFKK